MTPERKAAIEALAPFAAAWEQLRQGPAHLRKPGYALLSIGDAAVTATDLRRAAEAHAALTAPAKRD